MLILFVLIGILISVGFFELKDGHQVHVFLLGLTII